MFELSDGRLLVNEIAPRTHNSGHYTWGACVTSQFEQHVRAVCGLPLGDPRAMSGAVMVNLIGDLWKQGPPPWRTVLDRPEARLHLYGKDLAAPGRKMGHVLLLDDNTDRALATADEVIAELTPRSDA
jgi:5-(carboxyamino)imidazole ribonucleotide synthase